jgi:hypothetical protein
MNEQGSKSFTLNTSDVVNLAKNAVLVGLAAVLTYVGENITNVDLGTTGVMIVPLVSVGIDTLVKWIKNNTKKEENV